MRLIATLPILFIPALALAQPAPMPPNVAVPMAPAAPRPSPDIEVLGQDYMDMLRQNMTLKIQLNMAQRRWDDMCKAHADQAECKKPE